MQSVTLIIDKRRELPAKYKKLLESSANQVTIEKELLGAMKTIQNLEPDLIIISGDDLSEDCRKIRALTYNMRPIIVGMSKSAELEDKLQVLDAGADDFISEPVNPDEFKARIHAHLRREYESNLDYKKLMPDKNCSMRALKRVVAQNSDWACLLISIENLQNYTEVYTELASDKLVQTFAAITRSALGENDYFGADNDFLIITDPVKAERIANYLTFTFDAVVPKFYSVQDNARGFVLMQGDEFAGRRSNFVHLAIGVVSNEFVQYNDPQQLRNALVQTHRLARNLNKSAYIIERPRISGEAAALEVNNRVAIFEKDEALLTLLTTILELQGYEVSNENPAVVILDAEEGLGRIKDFGSAKVIVTSIFHDKERILSAGADLYLPKPYEPAHLIRWVAQLDRGK
jgi:DNA-binding response OmpR family regulator